MTLTDIPPSTDSPPCAFVHEYLEAALASVPHPPLHVAPLGTRNEMTATPAGYAEPPLGVFLYGRTAIVGPAGALNGRASPCHHCLALRWQKLRSLEERNSLEQSGRQQDLGESPYVFEPSCRLIADVITALVSMPASRLHTEDHGFPYVYEIELDSGQIRRYPLIADPECAVCSVRPADSPEYATIELRSRSKPDPDTFREKSIHDYRLPIEVMANPVCGALGRAALPDIRSTTTAPVTGYMYMRGSQLLHEFFWSGHADSYADSSLLAVFEGLERYAGLHRRGVTDPLIASYDELVGRALDPRECGLYDDAFYRSPAGTFYTPFTTDLRMPWVWGYSLRDNRPILVPERIVYYLGQDDSSNFVQECSNGCASGASLEEAILHGLMELIERDAFLLGWYGKAPLTEIDPSTCRRPDIRTMIDRVRLAGYDVRLFDNTVDLRVPVVTGAAVRRDGGFGQVSVAAGASPDPEAAVAAALCEIASYVPGFEERVTGQYAEATAMAEDFYKVTDLHHHPLVFGLPEMREHTDFLLDSGRPARPLEEIYTAWNAERPRTTDLLDDLRHCLDILMGRGFDVIVVDQTSAEQRSLGVHTAAVVVPGLIPIDFGWAKQRALHMPRMRTAFRDAGWRDTEVDPAELHLVPHPFP